MMRVSYRSPMVARLPSKAAGLLGLISFGLACNLQPARPAPPNDPPPAAPVINPTNPSNPSNPPPAPPTTPPPTAGPPSAPAEMPPSAPPGSPPPAATPPPPPPASAPPLPPVLEGLFSLSARHDGRCLEVMGGSHTDGVYLQTSICRGSYSQLFRIDQASAGTYRLANVESAKCVEVEKGGLEDGVKLRQMPCRIDAPEQFFRLEPAANAEGHVQIVSTPSGRCLDAVTSGAGEVAIVQQSACNRSNAQAWLPTRTFLPYPHQVRVKHSGKCLEAPMGGVEQTVLRQYPCSRTEGQLFRLEPAGPGIFSLVNTASTNCVDVPMSQLGDGVQVWEWRCNGTSAQWFRIEGLGGNLDRIVNVNSNKCLAVVDGAGVDGVAVGQFTCSGADNQKWALTTP